MDEKLFVQEQSPTLDSLGFSYCIPCVDEEIVKITGHKSTMNVTDNLVKEKTCVMESDQVPKNSASVEQHQNSMKNIVSSFRELHQIYYHENLVDLNQTYEAPMNNDEVNHVTSQLEENKGSKRKVRFSRPNLSRMGCRQPLDYVVHSENNDVQVWNQEVKVCSKEEG